MALILKSPCVHFGEFATDSPDTDVQPDWLAAKVMETVAAQTNYRYLGRQKHPYSNSGLTETLGKLKSWVNLVPELTQLLG